MFQALRVSVLPFEKLRSHQKKVKTLNVKPLRGDIVDRKGEVVATSTWFYSFFADPSLIEDPYQVAHTLSKKLGQSWRFIYKKIRVKKNRFIILKPFVTPLEKEKMESYVNKIKGLGFKEYSRRVYPKNTLLAATLGFTGRSGEGLEGLELYYNEALKGKSKELSFQKDAKGRLLLADGEIYLNRPDGFSLHLTLDANIQFYLEKILGEALEKHKAEAAWGVVLNPKNGEILALSSLPSFDPNAPFKVNPSLWRNRAVSDVYEPGSVLKPFTYAVALSEGQIEVNSVIDAEQGELAIKGRVIKEAAGHKFGKISITEALAKSSNVVVAKVALQLGQNKLREAFKKFGFLSKTNVDLPGETAGFFQRGFWPDHTLASVSFGHAITVNSLQVASAYAAIANGGWLYRPFVVKQVVHASSGRVIQTRAKKIKQIFSKKLANELALMLLHAVGEKGTGYAARVSGYTVAGKTGTAQKVDVKNGGYISGKYLSSFVGFVPVENPQAVIYIVVDSPKKGYYGSTVAAPIFRKVAEYVMRHKLEQPSLISKENIVHLNLNLDNFLKNFDKRYMKAEDLKGLNLKEVVQVLSESYSDQRLVTYEGRGRVKDVLLKGGKDLFSASSVKVVLEEF